MSQFLLSAIDVTHQSLIFQILGLGVPPNLPTSPMKAREGKTAPCFLIPVLEPCYCLVSSRLVWDSLGSGFTLTGLYAGKASTCSVTGALLVSLPGAQGSHPHAYCVRSQHRKGHHEALAPKPRGAAAGPGPPPAPGHHRGASALLSPARGCRALSTWMDR